MNVNLNSKINQISSLRTGHFSKGEKEIAAVVPTPNSDQITISQEGRDRMETLADKVESQLNTMTKEDFMDLVKQAQSENQNKLEVDAYRMVDPDGSIARKTYFESYIGQLMNVENTIKSYYAGAYEEAMSAPIDGLAFISGKYLCSWSDYFDSEIPEKERQWTHHQLWAMLTDSHVALNDPYALAASGGAKTVVQMDEVAQQAVKDKLDALVKQYENQ